MLVALRTLSRNATVVRCAKKAVVGHRNLNRGRSTLKASPRPVSCAWSSHNHFFRPSIAYSTTPVVNELEDDHSDVSAMIFDYGEAEEEKLQFVPGDIFRDGAIGEKGSIEGGADAWIQSVEELPQDVNALSRLLLGYTRTNQWERIENVWKTLFGEDSPPTFEPDGACYTFLMRSYGERFGKSTLAKTILEVMESKNIPVSAHNYAYFMLSHARDGQPSTVLETFDILLKSKLVCSVHDVRVTMKAMATCVRKVDFFVQTFQSLITRSKEAFLSSDRAPKGKHKLKMVESHWQALEMELFGFAVSKSLANYDVESANGYANKILESSSTLFSPTIVHVAKWYLAKGQVKEAQRFVNSAILRLDRGLHAHSQGHSNMVPARVAILMISILMTPTADKRAGVVAALSQFYTLLPSYKAHDAVAFASYMMQTLLKHRCHQEFFEVADHVERTLGNAAALTRVFNFRMTAHVQLRQPEEAVKFLVRMQSDVIHKPDPRTSSVLISMTAKLHGGEDAKQLLEAIITSVGVPQINGFEAVTRAFCKENRVDDALGVIELMRKNGVPLSWQLYEPIMDLYRHKNLLGKQFNLFNTLTSIIPDEPPSSSMTAHLLVGCIRQGYLVVAQRVAEETEKRSTPLTLPLMTSLVDLAHVTNNNSQLQLLAERSLKMAHSTELSPKLRVHYGNLALRAFSFLNQFSTVESVFQHQMVEKMLPLNIGTLNTMIAATLRSGASSRSSSGYTSGASMTQTLKSGKRETSEQMNARYRARKLFNNRLALFGPDVATKAESNSITAALLIRMRSPTEYEKVKRTWLEIVERARERKSLAASRQSSLAEADVSTDAEEVSDDVSAEIGEKSKVTLLDETEDEIVSEENLALPPEVDPLTGELVPAEVVSLDVMDSVNVEAVNMVKRLPKLTIQIATAVLEHSHAHLPQDAKFALDVLAACEEFHLPHTDITWSTKALALASLGDFQAVVEVLTAMHANHFEVTHDLMHALLYLVSLHPIWKHSLGNLLLRYMEETKLKGSPRPNLATYNLLLLCCRPNTFYYALSKLLGAGYSPNSQSLLSIANNMLKFQTPLRTAIHDTFVVIDYLRDHYQVQPCTKLFTALATSVNHHKHVTTEERAHFSGRYFVLLSAWLKAAKPSQTLDAGFFRAVRNLITAEATKQALQKLERPGESVAEAELWVQAISAYTAAVSPTPLPPLQPIKILLQQKEAQPKEPTLQQKRPTTPTKTHPALLRARNIALGRDAPSPSPFGRKTSKPSGL